jgi:CRISPR-associated protein (TIGR02710 family)
MAAKCVNGVLCPPVCERFLSLDDAAFERAAAEAIARLETSSSRDDAQRIYDHDVFPVEMERIRREAVRRAVKLDLLFVTVGAQANSPTLAAIASPARFVVLVHTVQEKASADTTVQRLGLDATEARLLCIDDGKDSARLYRAVFDEWIKHGRPEQVGVDITGGLKVMSAAAAAAAFALPHGKTYYIDTEKLQAHNDWWVRERRIELANPFQVFGEIRRATGRELLKTRRYAAAAAVYSQLYEEEDRSRAQLAEGYDALERLDFEKAEQRLNDLCVRLDVFSHDLQRKDDAVVRQRDAIRATAKGAGKLRRLIEVAAGEDPGRNARALRAAECLDFGEMLLAAAERHAAPDVAALLAYRCLELVPQRRLAFRANVDPGAVDWDVLAQQLGISVADVIGKYNAGKKKEHHLDPAAPPSEISSAVCYGLLAIAFPEDVAKELPVAQFAGAGAARNRSVLAHGLQQLERKPVDDIRTKARRLFDALLDAEKVSPGDRAALRQRHAFVEVE